MVIKDCQGATGERRHHKVARSAGLANPNREGAGDLPIPREHQGSAGIFAKPSEDALADHKLWKGFNMGLKEKLLQFRGTEPVEVDWEIEKEKWLVSVRVLYEQIHTWLDDLVNENMMRLLNSPGRMS